MRRRPLACVPVIALTFLSGCTAVTPGRVYADPGVEVPTAVVYTGPPADEDDRGQVDPPGVLERAGDDPTWAGGEDGSPSGTQPTGRATVDIPGGEVVVAVGDRPVELAAAPEEVLLPEFKDVAYVEGELPAIDSGQVLVEVAAEPVAVSQWLTKSLVPPTWSQTTVERLAGQTGTVYRVRTLVAESAAGPVELTYDVYPALAGGSAVLVAWDYFWQPAVKR